MLVSILPTQHHHVLSVTNYFSNSKKNEQITEPRTKSRVRPQSALCNWEEAALVVYRYEEKSAKGSSWAREMPQWLRVCTAFAEDPSSGPSTCSGQHWVIWHPLTHSTGTHIHVAHICTHTFFFLRDGVFKHNIKQTKMGEEQKTIKLTPLWTCRSLNIQTAEVIKGKVRKKKRVGRSRVRQCLQSSLYFKKKPYLRNNRVYSFDI